MRYCWRVATAYPNSVWKRNRERICRRQLLYAGKNWRGGIQRSSAWPSSVFRNQWIQSSMMMHTASDEKRL